MIKTTFDENDKTVGQVGASVLLALPVGKKQSAASSSAATQFCFCQICTLPINTGNIIRRVFKGMLLQRCEDCEKILTAINGQNVTAINGKRG